MSTSKNIVWVGALAVALGVGFAIANAVTTPSEAWPDEPCWKLPGLFDLTDR
jgi:hypothetical protein